jgi:THO complex subunit 7
MLLQLSQCELASEKFLLGSNTSDAELKSYEELNDSIKDRLETAKKEIEDAKEALRAAKEVRKNRVQYNVLAKVIKEQPDRKETLSKLDEIKSDLSDLEVCNLDTQIKSTPVLNNVSLIYRENVKNLRTNWKCAGRDCTS